MTTIDYNATVTLKIELAPGTIVLRVKLDDGAFSYEAGQYTVLGLKHSSSRVADAADDRDEVKALPADQMIRRAYSITSNSKDDELEFVITLVRSGDLTPRLFRLKEGSRIFVENRASGIFTLDVSSGTRDLLLVATGTALAPYLSMIRTELPETYEHQFVVVQCAAVSWDLVFRAQLEELDEKSKHLTYLSTITEPERDKTWNGLIGDVVSLLKAGEIEDIVGMPITPDRFDVFLAGNPAMIDSVSAELKNRDFTTGHSDDPDTTIHVERYW
jgi:ferredoxin/flavodoxin---NADP+ reductase